ncbi:MAG TPA: tandem-95 repeat protein, partial [Gemmataceae bacterium]|nr:tandem-95 repeat protein [Gemmataceae bacterium]
MSAASLRPRLRLRPLEDRAIPAAFGFGSNGYDTAVAVAADGAGNVYVAGAFNGTVDFDPGPGTAHLASTGPTDVYLAKYTAAGTLVWAGQLVDASVTALTVDAAGAVYATGRFPGTTDFDFGPGVTNLTTGSSGAAFVVKYNPDSSLAWARQLGGQTANVQGDAIALDAAGNVYTSGVLNSGNADMDPGAGTVTLTNSSGNANTYISKLTPAGAFVWAKQFANDPSIAAGVWSSDLAVDAAQNVYVTGLFVGRVDFDTSASTGWVQTGNVSSASGDGYVVKLTATGATSYVVRIGSPNASEGGNGITVDPAGNAYVTGHFSATTTIDATAGDTNLSATGATDIFLLKLTPTGGVGWAKKIGSTGWDGGTEIVSDGSTGLYLTGYFTGTADFDPGAGVHTLPFGGGGGDVFALKMWTDGTFADAWALGGANYEYPQDIALVSTGDVAAVGMFQGSGDFDPGPGTTTLTSAGDYDAYVSVFPQVAVGQPVASNGTLTTLEDTAASGTLVATDPDNDPLTYSLVSTADAHGTVTITNAATGAYTYTPAADYFGPASFTFKATGGGSDSNVATVTITVTPVNDPPAFVKGSDQDVDEDAGPQTVSGWATGVSAGPNEAGQSLTFEVTTDNDPLFAVLPAVAANGTLTYRPAANAFGSATVTVTLTDGGGGANASGPQMFTITVNPVNDVPSFTAGPDQAATEGSGGQTVAGWATGLSAGPANEAGQSLTFDVTTDNDMLFSVVPQITPDGTLTYTPAAAAFGTATVTVTVSDDGGTANGGVDTSPPQTFTITLDPLNDAPTLAGDAELTAIPRNLADPTGDLVGDFAGPGITDPDPAPLEGIAVVGQSGTAAGAWEYSTDAGQTWLPLGTPSESAARLLRDTDRVRFVPAAGFVGTVALAYRAWDRTTGTPGGTADLTGGVGGTTAFSAGTATATLQVGITVTPVPEDTRSPKGDKVGALLNTFVSDPDAKAKAGIAVVGVANGSAGTWQYSVTGGRSWKPLAASPTQALLLRSTDKVRYLPAPGATGWGLLRYHAWDQTVGKAGTRVNVTAGVGGGTAFSTTRGIGFAEVPAVNDAPVLDVGGNPPLTPVAPTAADPAGDFVKDLLGSAATDAELDAIGMAVTAAAGKGTWQVKPDGAADWTPLGPVSGKAPKFLNPLDRVRFVPAGGALGAATLKFKAWDGTL